MQAELRYKNSVISYTVNGQGDKQVICFHGYGETAHGFDFLNYPQKEFCFIAIDLPFHGNTKWNEGFNFSVEDLKTIVEEIINKKQKTINPALPAGREKLTLLGFSLGGRIALSLYGSMPGRIEKIVLLAPDGLKQNFWYWLSTQTWIGNRIFLFTMKHPGWFFGFLKILDRVGLVNRSIFKFVNYYIGDEQVRNDLYNRWTCLRKLRPAIGKIKSLVARYKTRVVLVYGKHDRIILPSRGEKFCKGIEANCQLSVIESGHQVLHEKHVNEIMQALTG